jgi:hypothetical protein
MNNFHIYEEVGRGKDSVVYKVRSFVEFSFHLEFLSGSGAKEEKRRIRRCQVC